MGGILVMESLLGYMGDGCSGHLQNGLNGVLSVFGGSNQNTRNNNVVCNPTPASTSSSRINRDFIKKQLSEANNVVYVPPPPTPAPKQPANLPRPTYMQSNQGGFGGGTIQQPIPPQPTGGAPACLNSCLGIGSVSNADQMANFACQVQNLILQGQDCTGGCPTQVKDLLRSKAKDAKQCVVRQNINGGVASKDINDLAGRTTTPDMIDTVNVNADAVGGTSTSTSSSSTGTGRIPMSAEMQAMLDSWSSGSTSAQAPSGCSFPFVFRKKSYTACTTVGDSAGKAWCSTKVDDKGAHVSGGGHFRYCSDTTQHP